MSIKATLLADQAEQQAASLRQRCRTCIAVDSLEGEAHDEIEEIMTDKSFQDASIARWLSQYTATDVGKASVGSHRKSHLT